jgi:hypothetical protein
MFRPSTLLIGAALLSSSAGCRSCNHPWFTASNTRGPAPCQLVGSGKPLAEGCYDAITGQPVPCPPANTLIPGGGYPGAPTSPPNELPYPSPTDMIPRPGVPYAPPTPAPGVGL